MHRGYVKIWRKIEDSGLMGNASCCQLFLYLLLKASHKERKYPAGGLLLTLLPGQLVTGRKQLADELRSTEQRVRTALKLLEKQEIINQRPTSRFTIISIVNWNRYQAEQPAANQPPTTKQECKHEEMKREEEKSRARTRVRKSGGSGAGLAAHGNRTAFGHERVYGRSDLPEWARGAEG